jgi:hypothetical protein
VHLITAQEVAGLNPAEVTRNEEVNDSSFFFRVTYGVTIHYLPLILLIQLIPQLVIL